METCEICIFNRYCLKLREQDIKKFADENPLVSEAQKELDEVIEELDTKLDNQLKK